MGGTVPKADMQSLDESLGVLALCQALMPRLLACNLPSMQTISELSNNSTTMLALEKKKKKKKSARKST